MNGQPHAHREGPSQNLVKETSFYSGSALISGFLFILGINSLFYPFNSLLFRIMEYSQGDRLTCCLSAAQGP